MYQVPATVSQWTTKQWLWSLGLMVLGAIVSLGITWSFKLDMGRVGGGIFQGILFSLLMIVFYRNKAYPKPTPQQKKRTKMVIGAALVVLAIVLFLNLATYQVLIGWVCTYAGPGWMLSQQLRKNMQAPSP